MDGFNLVAGIASILGLFASALAAFQARRASQAAAEARQAVITRPLSDELRLACVHAEQLVHYISGSRHQEAALRADELTFHLSELPFYRGDYLPDEQCNAILTARQQVESISTAMAAARSKSTTPDSGQILIVARRIAINLPLNAESCAL
jgi:hypothetical protein